MYMLGPTIPNHLIRTYHRQQLGTFGVDRIELVTKDEKLNSIDQSRRSYWLKRLYLSHWDISQVQ